MKVLAQQEFIAEFPECHPLFRPDRTPSGGISLFLPDWMHTKSLGTDAELVGSAVVYMCKKVLNHGSEDLNIAVVWAAVQAFYRANRTRCRLGRLTMNMVKHDPFPRLSAKAVETRDLLPALEFFFRDWVHQPVCAWFHRLLLLSVRMDQLVFSNPGFLLTVRERQRFKELVFGYNQTLTRACAPLPHKWGRVLQLHVEEPLSFALGSDSCKGRLLPKGRVLLPGRGFHGGGEILGHRKQSWHRLSQAGR